MTNERGRRARRRFVLGAAGLSVALLAACSSSGSSGSSDGTSDSPDAGADLGLIKSGEVSVGFMNGLMPYIGLDNGELTGVDGDLFTHAVAPLNLTVKPQGMEFSAMIAGVQSGRYDIGIGGIAWTEEREKAGIFSDPVYYSPLLMLAKPGLTLSTVSDLDGLTIGAPTATLNLQAIQAVPGVTAKAYPSWDTAVADLKAGRVDALSIDPLLAVYTQQQDPELKDYGTFAITPPTEEELAENPKLSAFIPYQVVWYCSTKAENLCDTLSKTIDTMFTDGTSVAVMKKWGVDPEAFLTANDNAAKQRIGVDRPEGWVPPSLSS